jgi:hypothetical protein
LSVWPAVPPPIFRLRAKSSGLHPCLHPSVGGDRIKPFLQEKHQMALLNNASPITLLYFGKLPERQRLVTISWLPRLVIFSLMVIYDLWWRVRILLGKDAGGGNRFSVEKKQRKLPVLQWCGELLFSILSFRRRASDTAPSRKSGKPSSLSEWVGSVCLTGIKPNAVDSWRLSAELEG